MEMGWILCALFSSCLFLCLYSDAIMQLLAIRFKQQSTKRLNIVITGASSGLGQGTAWYLGKKGHNVFAVDIKPFKHEVGYSESSNVFSFVCDVSDRASCLKFKEELKKCLTEKGLAGIDAVINFAGINILAPLLEMDSNDLRNLFNINVFGTINMCSVLHPLLNCYSHEYYPRFVNVSSEVAFSDINPAFTPYAMTKIAIKGFSNELRQELQLLPRQGTKRLPFEYDGYAHVVTVFPGACETQMTEKDMMLRHLSNNKDSKWKESLVKGSEITNRYTSGKKISPYEIAQLMEHIVSVRSPLRNYTIGVSFSMRVARLVPQALQDFMFCNLLGFKASHVRQIL